MLRSLVLGCLLVGLILIPSGCIAVGSDTHQPTLGQELIDLKGALDRGAISPAEYDTKKSDLLAHRR